MPPEPYVPFAPLTLAPGAAIDLQMHTTFSDGRWSAAELLDHVAAQGFSLVAITDHDRMDTIEQVQRLAGERGVHVLPAVEMSASLEGNLFDILCFGVRPAPGELAAIAADTTRRQQENVRSAYDRLRKRGLAFARAAEVLAEHGAGSEDDEPRTLDHLLALLRAHGYTEGLGPLLDDAGFQWITADPGAIVEAAHAIGALALIAHPGRGDGFARFDAAGLDQLRASLPIDGFEARHPTHTPAQVDDFLAYAQTHHLLVSAGSDSHGPPGQMPIPYPAASCRELLARLGVTLG